MGVRINKHDIWKKPCGMLFMIFISFVSSLEKMKERSCVCFLEALYVLSINGSL